MSVGRNRSHKLNRPRSSVADMHVVHLHETQMKRLKVSYHSPSCCTIAASEWLSLTDYTITTITRQPWRHKEKVSTNLLHLVRRSPCCQYSSNSCNDFRFVVESNRRWNLVSRGRLLWLVCAMSHERWACRIIYFLSLNNGRNFFNTVPKKLSWSFMLGICEKYPNVQFWTVTCPLKYF